MEQAPSPLAAGDAAAAEPTPDWPPWFAFVGFLAALLCTITAVGLIAVFAGIDSSDDTPELVILATAIQSVFFVGVALVFARSVTPPRRWHFGLRRAPLWRTVLWAAIGMLSYYLLTAVYGAVVDPQAEQDVTDSLGAEDSTIGLIAAGVMIVVVAPFVEELFFRGFFYRALRTRYPMVLAAAVDGLVFGLIHYNFEGAEMLLLLPPLAFLGMVFCLVYEKTGTLWSVVGLHALNNAIAFSVQADEGWQVAVVAGPLMLVACAAIPRLMRDGPAPLPPPAHDARRDAQLSLPVE